jgi:methionyl-tRNA formyltransferase
LIDRIGKKGPAFLNTTLEKIAQQQLKPRDQDEDKISISSKISKEDGEINPFSESIQSIYTKTRAFALRPKTYFFLDNQRIIVEKLILDENLFAKHAQDPLLNKDFSLNPCVLTLRIKPENKSERDRKDFSHTLSPKNNAIKPSS